MGCGRKAIAEDEDEYRDLCKHFREPATDGPYSEHASLLKQRNEALAKLSPEDKRVLGLTR